MHIVLAAVTALALLPATAHAATVRLVFEGSVDMGAHDGGSHFVDVHRLELDVAPGEDNRIAIERMPSGPGVHVLAHGGAPLHAGAGCSGPDGDVACPTAQIAEVRAPRLDLGDGDDRLVVTGFSVEQVFAGPGDDTVVAPFAAIDGGAGADVMDGETATVTYADRAAGVNVTIGLGADDGEPGEGDHVGAGISRVTGTAFADRLDGAWARSSALEGGAGDDVLFGGDASDSLDGGDGDDRLRGGPGEDRLAGGAGADVLAAGPARDEMNGGLGADVFHGGRGRDLVSYAERTRGVTVRLTDGAPDGEPGEGDAVGPDVENVHGGEGHDVLAGNRGRDRLVGNDGDDTLLGRAGDDRLVDWSRGGTTGENRLVGGRGNDRVRTTATSTIDVSDGQADLVLCRGLNRAVTADRHDTLRDCAPDMTAGPGDARATGAREVRVPVRCESTAGRCTGTLVLSRGERPPLGSARFSLPPGAGSVSVRLRTAPPRRLYVTAITRRRFPKSRHASTWHAQVEPAG